MKRIAQTLVGLVLVGLIGFVVWHDWLRDRFELQPAGVPMTPQMQPEREIVGIGAILKREEESGALLVIGTVPNSPAAKAGLAPGWVIHRINDQATGGLSLQDCVALIRGPAGTKLRLQWSDAAQLVTNTVELRREKIPLPPAPPLGEPR